jgi:hypothetical protein
MRKPRLFDLIPEQYKDELIDFGNRMCGDEWYHTNFADSVIQIFTLKKLSELENRKEVKFLRPVTWSNNPCPQKNERGHNSCEVCDNYSRLMKG